MSTQTRYAHLDLNIDWVLLREQKLKLYEVICYLQNDDPEGWVDPLEGILSLLDGIQDDAMGQFTQEEIFGKLSND